MIVCETCGLILYNNDEDLLPGEVIYTTPSCNTCKKFFGNRVWLYKKQKELFNELKEENTPRRT